MAERDGPFAGEVVIVTGSSRGIGKATAVAFARAGAHVIVNYNSSEAGARNTLEQIEAGDAGSGEIVQADVGAPDGCRRLAEAAGPVTVLVNNAAGFNRDRFLDVTMEEFDRVWHINVRGVYYLSQLIARKMVERGRGAIVHVSSILARLAIPRRSVYCATKGALEALTRAMALDLAPHNVRVNAVSPGLIETEAMKAGFANDELLQSMEAHIPAERFGDAGELAQAVLFLASDAASYINGVVLSVDGALGAREAGPVE